MASPFSSQLWSHKGLWDNCAASSDGVCSNPKSPWSSSDRSRRYSSSSFDTVSLSHPTSYMGPTRPFDSQPSPPCSRHASFGQKDADLWASNRPCSLFASPFVNDPTDRFNALVEATRDIELASVQNQQPIGTRSPRWTLSDRLASITTAAVNTPVLPYQAINQAETFAWTGLSRPGLDTSPPCHATATNPCTRPASPPRRSTPTNNPSLLKPFGYDAIPPKDDQSRKKCSTDDKSATHTQKQSKAKRSKPSDSSPLQSETKHAGKVKHSKQHKSKTKPVHFSDIKGHVIELCTDQHGSRLIQQKLELASLEDRAWIFAELQGQIVALMADVFGNYVVQKFLDMGTSEQRKEIVQQMQGRVVSLSLQMHGCRVVQKALERVCLRDKEALIVELKGNVLECVRDQNGNHVIQKAIEQVPFYALDFVLDSFYANASMLATHPYGCRVIQRILDHCGSSKRQVLDKLLQMTSLLVEDQYGNYVIQQAVECGEPQDRALVADIVTASVLAYSRHKFASNVVEKCIAYGDEAQKTRIVDKLLATPAAGFANTLVLMVKDQFANYVVQRLLESTSGALHDRLVTSILPHIPLLKRCTHGRQLTLIEKMVKK